MYLLCDQMALLLCSCTWCIEFLWSHSASI